MTHRPKRLDVGSVAHDAQAARVVVAPDQRHRTRPSEAEILDVDTGRVQISWTHVGRLWTNGDPYLAVDSARRGSWLGYSNDAYFEQVIPLALEQATSIPVGDGTAALVGADALVSDEGWMELFESADGTVTIVQATGRDYRQTLHAALERSTAAEDTGTVITVPSRELALFSAALDGAGDYAVPLLPARPGPAPAQPGPPFSGPDTALCLPARNDRYELKVHRCTTLGKDERFALWHLAPVQQSLMSRSNLG
jgi:hypothetical protein